MQLILLCVISISFGMHCSQRGSLLKEMWGKTDSLWLLEIKTGFVTFSKCVPELHTSSHPSRILAMTGSIACTSFPVKYAAFLNQRQSYQKKKKKNCTLLYFSEIISPVSFRVCIYTAHDRCVYICTVYVCQL